MVLLPLATEDTSGVSLENGVVGRFARARAFSAITNEISVGALMWVGYQGTSKVRASGAFTCGHSTQKALILIACR